MNKIQHVLNKYPITKGMIVYATLMPSADLCRQIGCAAQNDEKLSVDFPRLLRYSIYGSLWVAPTMFYWVRFSSRLIPGVTFRVAAFKACLEQFSYGPFSIVSFYFLMNILEGKGPEAGIKEARKKFLPTWKTGVTYWPFVQTLNFSMVPINNRVAFAGCASFIWTTYLSFMKMKPS